MTVVDAVRVGTSLKPRARRGGGADWKLAFLLAPALLLLACAYLAPVGTLLLSSFDAPAWTLRNYSQIVTDAALWQVLRHTFELAGEVTLLCIVLGYPIAYTMLNVGDRLQKLIVLLVVIPMWTSVLVRAYAWMILLGRSGLLNQLLQFLGLVSEPVQFLYTRFAVVVGLVHVMLPYFVLPAFGVMKRVDLRLLAASRSLGAGQFSTFLFVFLPLTLPGVASGGLLVFILSVGFFVTPSLLGGLQETTYVMIIEKQVNQLLNWDIAAAMSVVLLLCTSIVIVIWSKLLGFGALRGEDARVENPALGRTVARIMILSSVLRRHHAMRPAIAGRARRGDSHRLVKMITAVTLVFIVVPIIIFFPLSFSGSPYLEFPPSSYSLRWYANYFSRYDWIAPTVRSFEVAIATTAIATLLGTIAAIGIARGRFRGRTVWLGILTAPAITPTLVIAVGLYFQFASIGLIGTVAGLIVAHLVLALPLVVVVVLGALKRVDEGPERAARSLGAHPVIAFSRITLPMIRPSILSGAFFAFLASFDDVVMALFLSGTSATTLPKRMWDGIVLEIDPTTAAVSTLLICLSVFLLVVLTYVTGHQTRGSIAPRELS
jgi:putative spermidine/putrescine transport system permease protein